MNITHRDTEYTEAEHRALIEKQASANFKDHVLIRQTEDRFYCRKPGTGYYSFWLTFLPDYIVLTRDIGSQVFFPGYGGSQSSFHWLLMAVNSMDYVLEKARHPGYAFLAKQAEAYCLER